jgi:hypothetical protein
MAPKKDKILIHWNAKKAAGKPAKKGAKKKGAK